MWSLLNALRPSKTDPPTTVDLSGLQLARPYSLAAIAALGCLSGKRSQLILPRSADCQSYVLRNGLDRFFSLAAVPSVTESSRVVAVRQLETPSSTFADEVVQAWDRQFGGIQVGLSGKIADHLDEVIRNALSHAESAIGCIVAATVYPQTKRVEVAVLDLGQTIRGHLTKNPKYVNIKTDEEAIELATHEGITGTPAGSLNKLGEPNSGIGLYELRSYCENQGGGDLTILSGNAMVTYSPSENCHVDHFAGGFPGCLINMQFIIW